MADSPVLRVISPDASPEELAAITAAIEVVRHERARSSEGGGVGHRRRRRASRRLGAGVAAHGPARGLLRGPWRLSGRIDRRARA